MSMTLMLAVVSPAQFAQLEVDPGLIEWLCVRSSLDWSTTLRGYILEPEACEARDLERMEQVDAFALAPEDFYFIDYLAVSRLLEPQPVAFDFQQQNRMVMEAFARSAAGDPSALQTLQQQAKDLLARLTPDAASAREEELDESDDEMFAPDGELEYDEGYGNCMFWSPDAFASVVSTDRAWLQSREASQRLTPFIERALAKRSYVVGIVR